MLAPIYLYVLLKKKYLNVFHKKTILMCVYNLAVRPDPPVVCKRDTTPWASIYYSVGVLI